MSPSCLVPSLIHHPLFVAALTGNIASGKSLVADHFARRGATIIDADVLAREAVLPGTPAYRDIVARWGAGVLLPDESIDRDALRRIAFGDEVERMALNAIVHPRVQALRQERLAAARRRGDRIVVCVIPLLFEAGLDRDADRVVLVDAPESVRLERLRTARGLTESEARQMIAAQTPAGQKRSRAHYVIDNSGTLDELFARADEVWFAIEREAMRQSGPDS